MKTNLTVLRPEQPFDPLTLALRLGISPGNLAGMVIRHNRSYKKIRIRKTRGYRLIHSPEAPLKFVLRRLNRRVLEPLQAELGDHVVAYRKGRSCRDAVTQHLKNRKGTYIKLDLKDFFHSTRKTWVRQMLHKLDCNPGIRDTTSSLVTVNTIPGRTSGVPQGSPASGAICNLVANQRLDKPILTFLAAQKSPWVYTRYSDDLAFSCPDRLRAPEIRDFLWSIKMIVMESGFKVNPRKTGVSGPASRKRMLGIVFNEKLNVPWRDYDRMRAILHNCQMNGFQAEWRKYGSVNVNHFQDQLEGWITYCKFIAPERGAKLERMYQDAAAP